MTILITGVAGFIGSALALKLLSEGQTIIGIDNVNDYYDPALKKNRLARCYPYKNFTFYPLDIIDHTAIKKLFSDYAFDTVIHLAAQAGVRYSVENPRVYIDSNLVGFGNILEECRQKNIKHFVYASSSSVYGANTQYPFSEHDAADHPLSLYGATKRANELMAHSYAHLYHLPCTGLRFFTVYGPWGRPDMALFKFTHHILNEESIPVYNHGKMMRDFTYIDDIVEGITRTLHTIPETQATLSTPLSAATSHAPYRIYNIGNHLPVELKKYIEILEHCLEKKAKLQMMPMQAGDVPSTYANVSDFENKMGVLPHTPIEIGIARFVDWYKTYYKSAAVTTE